MEDGLSERENGVKCKMKKVLSIAGSDCSGGAGIQADLKTFSAHGVFGMSVIVSVVAENTSRVIDIQDITPDMIEKQIDAVFEDIEVDAVKIGMLSTPECMKAVAKKLLQYKPQNVVIDPVMYPNHRRLFSFLLSGFMLLCKLPDILSPDGTHHLHSRSRRMDLLRHRSSELVPLPLPASGIIYPQVF